MTFSAYTKRVLPRLVLWALMATAMGMHTMQCFHIDQAFAGNVLLAVGAALVVQVPLAMAAFSRRSALIGFPLIALLAVAAGVLASTSAQQPLFADDYENVLLPFVVLAFTSLTLFLLTRNWIGTLVALVVGCVVCGAVEFLYHSGLVAFLVLYIASGTALLMIQRSYEHRDPERSTISFAAGPVSSILATFLAALVALGAFLLLIAPFHPPALELKLITESYSLQEVHVSGLTDVMHQQDPDEGSDQNNDDEQPTNEEDPDQPGQTDDASGTEGDQEDAAAGGSQVSLSGMLADVIRYFAEHWWLALVIGPLLLLAWGAVVAVRRLLRKRRIQRLAEAGNAAAVTGAYAYACDCLKRAYAATTDAKTPREFAQSVRAQTRSLEEIGSSASFQELTEVFIATAYGAVDPGESAADQALSYMSQMPKRLFGRLGKRAYLKLFFRV